MKPLFTEEEFNNAKSEDKLPCECYYCKKQFFPYKKAIKHELKSNSGWIKFCSIACHNRYKFGESVLTKCSNCNKHIYKDPSQIKKSKTGNIFCSKSCAATYNNKHKIHGTRRSKLEIYLEKQLTLLYPSLEILYNNKETINSELDIYIPSFKLAFELNGIFHYEPIFGDEKLGKIQNNDERKFQACLENQIELVLIDVSSLGYFKPKNADKYLNIIINIINKKLGNSLQNLFL